MVSSTPRCTPPMPPVANTRMPAIAAMIIVAATVQDSDRCRDSTGLTNRLLNEQRSFDVLRVGHAVANDGGLERHDRFSGREIPARGLGLCHFRYATTGFSAPEASVDLTPFVAAILNTDGNARAGLAASIAASFDSSSDLAQSHQDEVEIVRNLSRPLAILHGQEEQLVSEPYISVLDIPLLWHGRVQIIPGAGHAPHREQPETFNALLDAFVVEATHE